MTLLSPVQENELLHDIFGFAPKKKYNLGVEHQMSSGEKVCIAYLAELLADMVSSIDFSRIKLVMMVAKWSGNTIFHDALPLLRPGMCLPLLLHLEPKG